MKSWSLTEQFSLCRHFLTSLRQCSPCKFSIRVEKTQFYFSYKADFLSHVLFFRHKLTFIRTMLFFNASLLEYKHERLRHFEMKVYIGKLFHWLDELLVRGGWKYVLTCENYYTLTLSNLCSEFFSFKFSIKVQLYNFV